MIALYNNIRGYMRVFYFNCYPLTHPKNSKNGSIERSEGGSVKVMLRPFKKSPPAPNFNTC